MNYEKKIALFRPPSRSVDSESVLSFDELEDEDKDNVKRKTRNLSEKKRRDQFNILINELCAMVAANTKKMDKSTVLKSAIQFLKNHQELSVQSVANEIKEDWKPIFLCNEEFAQLMLEAVESFLLVFTHQGVIVFVSDSVASLLGHLPSDLVNHSLYDFMHEDDRLKFFNLLSTFQPQGQGLHSDDYLSFTCHLRRGSIDPVEPATYEYVKFFGISQLVELEDDGMVCDNDDFIGLEFAKFSLCFGCTIHLQTSHIIREMTVVDDAISEFTSRHSLEWKFLFLDHRAPPIIGYLPFEVLGTSGYDYYHPDDLEVVSKCHEQLMLMGKGRSNCYRFLTKGQQWIWLQTNYFVTYHQWNSKPEFIVCTNTVVRYGVVRQQLRQEMGYIEGNDLNITAVNSTTSTNSSSDCHIDEARECRPQQEGHVTSLSQSENVTRLDGNIVQSPDVASSQHTDNDRSQQPHSTKQESSTRRHHVSSQLQSLLQLHLQRSLATSSSSSLQATNSTTTATKSAVDTDTYVTETKASTSLHSNLASTSHQMVISQSRVIPSLAPLITVMSTSLAPVSTSQRLLSASVHPNMMYQPFTIVTSPLTSPAIFANPQMTYQSGLVLTPAQHMLHEQLMHKSEQLQNAIQRQQEELRFIKDQLAYAHGGNQMVSQQQHTQQQQFQLQQQSHLQQQQQQYVLQQHVGLSSQPILLTPTSTTAHLAMMGSSSNHIFLSPISEVGMDLQSLRHQQQQQSMVHCQHNQQQQLVFQQDPSATSRPMMLTPASPGPQLSMIRSSPTQMFVQSTNMDLLTSQQGQPQEQSLHFLGVSCSQSESSSTKME